MISSITGMIKSATSNTIVVEVGGIGVLIQVPNRIASGVKIGSIESFYTYLVVREDALTLFGFTDITDRDFFELLLSVTGIGPKVAQSILSTSDSEVVAAAISNGNLKTLESFPGLGKKGAQRLVLELKDKAALFSKSHSGKEHAIKNQVENALQGLGYSAKDAANMVSEVSNGLKIDDLSAAEILKLALKTTGSK
ncbi:MAG: Holliday junction branch migration protein RuvA [Actinobacteria bacterium]|nr:Holliday junction branch migration protein RuvA [Actinomycetota bacterium]NBO50902.1 Holliday junction branch migration protein RuvA [Actinomycetota bacterium]NCA25491.1 Holliday junction branch migration protein RuvA [Actinomycetota bacterium]NCU78287.1 Holliday junction branch migration protein RuvA [Actinomycetota bacterium]NCU96394.1 Holliday junction branch migration protein RuvA [Actinomycetota bacterium]